MGETVFVRWYGNVLKGEVVENDRKDQLAGMVAVRIPIQGVHATALFFPQHVYQSEDEATVKGNSPIISSNPPKVATEQREISRKIQKSPEIICEKIQDSPKNICSTTETDVLAQREETSILAVKHFLQDHWDHNRNHLKIGSLNDFYILWRNAHGAHKAEVQPRPVTLPSHTPKQNDNAANDEITARPQRDYGSQPTTRNAVKITLPSHKPTGRMRCWRCEHLDYDHISDTQETAADGEHFCGLHGRARVDPDGPQQNLNRKGGCGFTPRKQTVQLDLFS